MWSAHGPLTAGSRKSAGLDWPSQCFKTHATGHEESHEYQQTPYSYADKTQTSLLNTPIGGVSISVRVISAHRQTPWHYPVGSLEKPGNSFSAPSRWAVQALRQQTSKSSCSLQCTSPLGWDFQVCSQFSFYTVCTAATNFGLSFITLQIFLPAASWSVWWREHHDLHVCKVFNSLDTETCYIHMNMCKSTMWCELPEQTTKKHIFRYCSKTNEMHWQGE